MLSKCHLFCITSQLWIKVNSIVEVVAQNGKSIETGNAGHTRKRIKTKQKQAKNEHNVRWTALSAGKQK
jgi:hypothetical protein